MATTHEGARQYENTLHPHLEFFSKAGSFFKKSNSFYGDETTALDLFQAAWSHEKKTAFQLMLWLRDCRGGAGNRSGFRECLTWLAKNDGTRWIERNLHWIPLIGRWDDLKALYGTSLEKEAAQMWGHAIKANNILAAKWCDRKNYPVKHALKFKKEGDFRKFLANIRRDHIVEHKMSHNAWALVDYSIVPSVAMARYTKTFSRHDARRFTEYKDRLAAGQEKVNASVLFPHDCVRTAIAGDDAIANAQFDALPNFLEGTDERIIVLSDTSGSMEIPVSGSVRAIHISQGLALYCSAKIGKDNPFYKRFVGFGSEGKLKCWEGMSFKQAVLSRSIFDRAIASTRIDLALDLLLRTAQDSGISQQKMPTTLLIVSDMQFTHGIDCHNGTPVQACMKKWEKAGYKIPKLVYWNVAGYAGSPETAAGHNIALVSGFSPAILKSVFAGKDFSPVGIMKSALGKYVIEVPKAA